MAIDLIRHEDFIQPFTLHNSSIKGRMVRMGAVIDEMLTRHDNPAPVNRLLGELITLAAMLSASLPEGGILTLQAKGDGAVPFAVADAVNGGALRGYASIDEDKGLAKILALSKAKPDDEITLQDLMGKGYLAITLDMNNGSPYQGIVPLEGDSTSDAVQNYFTQSQQMNVMFKLFINQRTREDGTTRWRTGGIMLEQMPEIKDSPDIEKVDEKGWDYNALLAQTLTEDEMLDPHLASNALLYRLFNESGVWVDEQLPLSATCRCSRNKITNMLNSMDKQSQKDMQIDGIISVICQFCNKEERFNKDEI